jgi:dTDP-4-dehydrorhamnose reductase
MNFFFCKTEKPVILFYGHAGWIGTMYLDYLKKSRSDITVVNGQARIDDEHDVLAEIIESKPTHIVSFTGRTHGVIEGKPINTIDYLEYPGKLVENVRDNLFGPLNLANICKEHKIHYTYLGTGCIFNGTNQEQFTESSLPNYFGSGYSIVKGFTDRLIGKMPVLNLRIRMPISNESNPRNFITKITQYERVCSMENSMTVLEDFFPIFTELIVKKRTGTYNCTNPGTISHNEILKLYKQIVDHDFTWKNMSLDEQNQILKSARSNNHLDTTKIKREFPKLRNINEAVIVALNKMSLKIDLL